MWTVLRLMTDVVDILPLDGECAFFSSDRTTPPARKPPKPLPPHPDLGLVFAGPWPQFFEPEGRPGRVPPASDRRDAI